MGGGNKAATVCHRGGQGRAAGRAVNPAEAQDYGKAQASQGYLVSKAQWGESFFPQEDGSA